MPYRDIAGYVDEDDLAAYRHSYALTMLAMHVSDQSWSIEDRVTVIVHDQWLLGELRSKYDIAPEDTMTIALYDGAIIMGEE